MVGCWYVSKEESTGISDSSWTYDRKKEESRMIPRFFDEKLEGRMTVPLDQMGKAADGAGFGDESDQLWTC